MSSRQYRTITDLATSLGFLVPRQRLAAEAGLAIALEEIVVPHAREKFGHYQERSGDYAAWAALADRTKADRVAQGFPEDEPLLRTGDTRESIKAETDGPRGVVASDSKIMVYQELGTSGGPHGGPIPPRSVLGATAVETEEEAVHAVNAVWIKAFTG